MPRDIKYMSAFYYPEIFPIFVGESVSSGKEPSCVDPDTPTYRTSAADAPAPRPATCPGAADRVQPSDHRRRALAILGQRPLSGRARLHLDRHPRGPQPIQQQRHTVLQTPQGRSQEPVLQHRAAHRGRRRRQPAPALQRGRGPLRHPARRLQHARTRQRLGHLLRRSVLHRPRHRDLPLRSRRRHADPLPRAPRRRFRSRHLHAARQRRRLLGRHRPQRPLRLRPRRHDPTPVRRRERHEHLRRLRPPAVGRHLGGRPLPARGFRGGGYVEQLAQHPRRPGFGFRPQLHRGRPRRHLDRHLPRAQPPRPHDGPHDGL